MLNYQRVHNELENHHAIHGKTHYFDWAIFNSYVNVYQRVIQVNIHLERYWILFFMVSNINS